MTVCDVMGLQTNGDVAASKPFTVRALFGYRVVRAVLLAPARLCLLFTGIADSVHGCPAAATWRCADDARLCCLAANAS